MAITTFLDFMRSGAPFRAWIILPLLITLCIIAVLDAMTRTIPDLITLPGVVYALVIAAFDDLRSLGTAILGTLIVGGIVLLAAVLSRGRVGGGDVKLAAMLGAAIGWKSALVVLGLSQIIGGMVALARLIAGRRIVGVEFPIGAVVALLGAGALVLQP